MRNVKDDGLGEARSALKVACPQATAGDIREALRVLKAKNRKRGGA